MILITSMGGCASTSFIGWSSKRTKCNCPLNSEGIPIAGPGANPKGLKHRSVPPKQNDPYLKRENSFDRLDISEGPIKRAVFLYDTPYNMVLSLFRRNIAVGHAIAITGKRPTHNNILDNFLETGVDSFGFISQFDAWTNADLKCEYSRLLIRFDSLWENIDFLLDYMEICKSEKKNFLQKNERVNRMNNLTESQKSKLTYIYNSLNDQMEIMRGVTIL